MTTLSLIMAAIALGISIWGRYETYFTINRIRKNEFSKRLGEALVSAQLLKNTLSDNVDAMEEFIKNGNMVHLHFQEKLNNLNKEYEDIWNYVRAFEYVIVMIEKGKFPALNDQASIEAKIAHFNQRKVLAEFDISYLNKKIAEQSLLTGQKTN